MRWIVGLQPVREAIRARGKDLPRVMVEKSDSRELDALARFATDQGIPNVVRVDRAELDKVAKGAKHQGAAALAEELTIARLEDLVVNESTLIVALDEIQDPQNFGAIVRSSVGFGATGIVWPESHSAPLTSATFRASAGAVEHATLCRVAALPQALDDLKSRGVVTVGLDPQATVDIADVDLKKPIALVIGAEGKGLRRNVKASCEIMARLPMTNRLGSLNASVSAAIALYEAARQRRV
ncbi:MAG: 23S rRNA (guanosine(2251)-2'-O)-methyltransferase RlmB [Polyangiaceae bacterium]